jgi:hypothetical protein
VVKARFYATGIFSMGGCDGPLVYCRVLEITGKLVVILQLLIALIHRVLQTLGKK